MPQRRFHGFKSIHYGIVTSTNTDATQVAAVAAELGAGTDSTLVALDGLIAEPGVEGGNASMIEFLEQEGNPLDRYGNKVAGVQMIRFTVRARNLTAYDALKTAWDAGTNVYWRFILDNDERWHNTQPQDNWEELKLTNITARFQGTANQFEGMFMIPEQFITKTIT